MNPGDSNGKRVPATTIEGLDIHLYYLQQSQESMLQKLSNMATKEDIDAITDRLQDFATKQELSDKVRAVEQKVMEYSPGAIMGTIRAVALTIMAVASVLMALVAFIHWVKPGVL